MNNVSGWSPKLKLHCLILQKLNKIVNVANKSVSLNPGKEGLANAYRDECSKDHVKQHHVKQIFCNTNNQKQSIFGAGAKERGR